MFVVVQCNGTMVVVVVVVATVTEVTSLCGNLIKLVAWWRGKGFVKQVDGVGRCPRLAIG
ncbi:hypothetical protein E2C01_064791 [Portunus trituberculatus]|uniref:Uncharacterized protein n=1 Tax=Portunus trituberculatus TaxID=210409 RepID=A0A5B7HE04_PORTR|nr:hypothetical protein [Portunus trituberculatus]